MRSASIAMLAVVGLLSLAAGAGAADAAKKVGAGACAGCHQEQVEKFKSTPHGLRLQGAKGVSFEQSCETCHGAGGAHAEGGDVSAILNPAKAGEKGTESCSECHAGQKGRMFWAGSAHDRKSGGCMSCHKVHGGSEKLLAKNSEVELCSSCHRDVKAQMLKRSKHPLRDSSVRGLQGKMVCSSCHNPHGSQTEKMLAGKSINDTCYGCHGEKKAPMLWEHGPVKEDCLTCHSPHGSSNDKLLTIKTPRLCQNCHMQGRHQSGTLASNSVYAIGKACLNCHIAIHGSNHPSGAVLQR